MSNKQSTDMAPKICVQCGHMGEEKTMVKRFRARGHYYLCKFCAARAERNRRRLEEREMEARR